MSDGWCNYSEKECQAVRKELELSKISYRVLANTEQKLREGLLEGNQRLRTDMRRVLDCLEQNVDDRDTVAIEMLQEALK